MLLWYDSIGTYFKWHPDTDLRRVVWIAVTHNLKWNLMDSHYHTLCEFALYDNLATRADVGERRVVPDVRQLNLHNVSIIISGIKNI